MEKAAQSLWRQAGQSLRRHLQDSCRSSLTILAVCALISLGQGFVEASGLSLPAEALNIAGICAVTALALSGAGSLFSACGQALELVTIEPARALGMDHLIGSLEPGKRADIITINVNQPHLAPFGVMPVQRLVYHAMGQDVDMAIVDGVVAMENRRLTQIDEKKLLEDAARAFEKMTSRLNRPEVMENPNLWSSRPAGQRLG